MKVLFAYVVNKGRILGLFLFVLIALGGQGFAFSGAKASTRDAQASASETKTPTFAVASIKRNPKPTYMRLEFTIDGFRADGVTLRQLIQDAYGIYGPDRMIGEPQWVDRDYFDVEAKIDDSFAADFANLGLDQRQLMLQALLADRFGLVVHRSNAARPVYDLVIAKGGPKLQISKPDEMHPSEIKGRRGLITRESRGLLVVEGFSMDALAINLEADFIVDRPVVNRTGLTGYYNFSLHWIPEDVPTRASLGSQSSQQVIPPDPGGSSTIFTDIQKQLGLKLQPSEGPVEILVVDHAEAPTGN